MVSLAFVSLAVVQFWSAQRESNPSGMSLVFPTPLPLKIVTGSPRAVPYTCKPSEVLLLLELRAKDVKCSPRSNCRPEPLINDPLVLVLLSRSMEQNGLRGATRMAAVSSSYRGRI